MAAQVLDLGVDLADPETFARGDLGAYWRRLRHEDPVHWQPAASGRPGFWVVSRYADLMTVYRDPARFTSEQGNVLVTLLAGEDSAGGKMCAVTDGPRHREVRNVLLKSFSPRVLAPIADRVRRNTARRVARAVLLGECDFAAEVSEHVPMATVSDLLGVPESDRAFLLERSRETLSSGEAGQSEEDGWSARSDILLYFADLMEQRRGGDAEDVISVLVNARINGAPLSREEIVLNCYSLILGGDETSRLTMNDVVHTLAGEHGQWLDLREGRVGADSACEEALRWATPTMHFGRTATERVLLGGREIQPGDIVTVWHSSANRDETVFADPDRFDLARTPNRHVAFGYGPHFCLGAHLARVEITALLDALRRFTSDIEVVGGTARFHSNFLAGFSRLPVRFTPDKARLSAFAAELKAELKAERTA